MKEKMQIRPLFAKYVLAGIFNTITGYGIIILLIYLLKINIYLSFLISTFIGILLNFFVYSSYVFNNKERKNIYKFSLVYIVLYGIGNLQLYIFNSIGIYPYITMVFIIVINTIMGFLLNKDFVFKRLP